MAQKGAHHGLWEELAPRAEPAELENWRRRVEAHLELPPEEQEARAEPLFRELAAFTARALAAGS
jgi:hypothetical protein